YAHLEQASATIAEETSAALAQVGVPHTIQWAGSMFSVFFTDGPVTNYAQAQTQDTAAYGRFFHAMLDQGVHLPPSAYECWFVSAAHDQSAVNKVVEALPAAARAAAG
ncbi:MAG: aspartate aminotransferase family protein, partial [Nostocoides sp.]